MKILLAAGKTGGHIFPGIAIAQALKVKDAEHEICFVGTQNGLEAKVVPDAGYKLETIEVSGLKSKSLGDMLKALLRLPMAIFQSIQITQA